MNKNRQKNGEQKRPVLKAWMLPAWGVFGIAGAGWLISQWEIELPAWIGLAAMIWLVPLCAVGVYIGQSEKKHSRGMLQAKKCRQRVRDMAEHDELLPDLYCRKEALRRMQQMPADAVYTVAMIEVQNFREINDVYGHEFGDNMLIQLAQRFRESLKDSLLMAARYGSDEYLLLFPGKLSPKSAAMKQLQQLVHEPIRDGLVHLVPLCSIGLACSGKGLSYKDVLVHADLAVGAFREHPQDGVKEFSPEMMEQVRHERKIKELLHDAIQNDDFYLVYQPKVEVSSLKVVGYEALLRMKSTNLSPAQYIPIAEKYGLLIAIGRIVTQKTIQQLAAWRASGRELRPVSINFSPVQLQDTKYFCYLMDLLQQYHMPVDYLEIEITETILMQNTEAALELMRRFRSAGIHLLMDDFGKGYSSLNYLNSFSFDVIKIDKAFVDVYLQDCKKMTLVRDIIQLGHDLDMQIIVEGVENREQFIHLREMGADIIQGFYFSRPLPASEAIDFTVTTHQKV